MYGRVLLLLLPLLLLPALSAGLSLKAAVAAPGWDGGAPWAEVRVSWAGGRAEEGDWVGAFLHGYNATYVRYADVSINKRSKRSLSI